MCEGWKQIHNSPSRVCQQTFSIWKLKMLIVDSEGLTRQLVRKLCWSSSELFVLIYPCNFQTFLDIVVSKTQTIKSLSTKLHGSFWLNLVAIFMSNLPRDFFFVVTFYRLEPRSHFSSQRFTWLSRKSQYNAELDPFHLSHRLTYCAVNKKSWAIVGCRKRWNEWTRNYPFNCRL